MQTTNETIINVQEIEPRLRHETIFRTYENLQPGESLIIHNNHDPKPVFYQLQHMHGDTFSWDYLQEGPEWWDIRLTKNDSSVSDHSHEDDGDSIHAILVNVPALEPHLKHQTIFETFESLLPGESMVIHNDHDPRPVHYQLQNIYGEIYTWEYLETGPEFWDVLITKHSLKTDMPYQPEVAHAISKSEDGSVIITIPSIEPRLKHETIFSVFESLKEGESLIIHNDHDPKPVYYQLLGQHGDVFTWEYLQEGPEWWDIKVTIKGADDTETIGDITAKDWRKAQVFKKYGIDFCCGGKKSVKQACTEKGLDYEQIEKELHETAKEGNGGYTNYDEWNLDFLTDYIINTHHQYVRKNLPELVAYAVKVAKVHGNSHPELHEIQQLVEKVNTELSEHLIDEEQKLFPEVKKIVAAQNNKTSYHSALGHSFETEVDELEQEHDAVGRAMEKIRELSHNYALPEDACASYTLLFKMLEDFENDLFTHIHLENNILFPKAIEIEKHLA